MILDVHPRLSCFSRMRSEGFPFIVWGSGGWTLVRLKWLVASSSGRRCVVVGGRRRVVVASLIPCLWGKLQNLSFSKVSKPLAKENIQRKEKQSAHAKANGPQEIAAKKRKANEEAAIRGAASSSAQAEASSWSAATAFLPKSKKAARPFLEPESTDCKGIQLRSP